VSYHPSDAGADASPEPASFPARRLPTTGRARGYRDGVRDRITCVGCGDEITEDQTALRLTAGTAVADGSFSGLVLRPDLFVHAGTPSNGPWGDEPNGERWCATPENLRKALWELRIDATTGGSGTYRGD